MGSGFHGGFGETQGQNITTHLSILQRISGIIKIKML